MPIEFPKLLVGEVESDPDDSIALMSEKLIKAYDNDHEEITLTRAELSIIFSHYCAARLLSKVMESAVANFEESIQGLITDIAMDPCIESKEQEDTQHDKCHG